MSDAPATTVVAAASPAKSPKAKKPKAAGGPKKPKVKPNHPPTSQMVNNAIKTLKERGGSSLQAIKKFVSANYKIDADKMSPFIKKYLKGAVVTGDLVQTKGKGASGSFKLAVPKKAGSGDKKPKKSTGDKVKKASSKPKSAKKSAAKKSAPKKPAAEKKKAATSAKSAKKVGVKSTPKQKATKPKANSAKKPKTPKPKKAAPKKPAAKK